MTPELVAAGKERISSVRVDGRDVYWLEGRAQEGGRQVIVRRRAGGEIEDVLGSDDSARTLVHEYGGCPYAVQRGRVVFSRYEGQRIHEPDGTALTPDDGARYGDQVFTPDGAWILAVRERHPPGGEAVNDIVAVRAGGGEPVVLAEGRDFFLAPRVSGDGKRFCWLAWDHPNMPWDGCALWVGDLSPEMAVTSRRLIAGGEDEAISQPRFAPRGALHWVSDRSGWWNLYREGSPEPLAAREADFSEPDWVLGQSTYAFLDDGTLVAAWVESGSMRLGAVRDGAVDEIPTPYTEFDSVQAHGDAIVCVAASPQVAPKVVRIGPSGETETLRPPKPIPFDAAFLSSPRAFTFADDAGEEAHALFYAPVNPDFAGSEGERPPLIVLSHGGPTGRTGTELDLGIQFWTSRGVAVVDVDYRGSSGYGRAYRRALDGRWGVADVEDCVNAALYLAERGEADRERLVIRGGSAGGYTTLAALAFTDVYAAGSSHYGVADLEALARHTHKFESRYMDRLIGPYPETAELWRERSPIDHVDRLSCPLILFQGLEDMVVPPAQSETMAAALARKGIEHAYVAFEGEQHGFRRAETIVRVAEAELEFLGRVLGFQPAATAPADRDGRAGG